MRFHVYFKQTKVLNALLTISSFGYVFNRFVFSNNFFTYLLTNHSCLLHSTFYIFIAKPSHTLKDHKILDEI